MMNSGTKFATAINCIDGRTQRAVEDWAIQHFGVNYVDSITEPGVDGLLARRLYLVANELKKKAQISAEKHGSSQLVVAGHYDCAGNPVSDNEHQEHIKKAVSEIMGWKLFDTVVGVWVNKDWQIERVI